jgi:hypothetical protein
MDGTLSAVGSSPVFLVRPGQSFTYAVTVAAEEAFIGTVRLERSRNGGQTWEGECFVGTEEAPLEGTIASGTVVNSYQKAERYRLSVEEIDEASDDVAYAFTEAVDVVERFVNAEGVEVLTLTDEGIATPKVTADALVAPGHLIDFSALPATDPEIAGLLWLDTGVLKISTGPA